MQDVFKNKRSCILRVDAINFLKRRGRTDELKRLYLNMLRICMK